MNTPTLPVLTGTAVTLRPITDADTDLIVKWRNTQSVVQNFIFRQTFTPEMHRSWLATKVATGQVVQYIILDNADGKPVGSVYYIVLVGKQQRSAVVNVHKRGGRNI